MESTFVTWATGAAFTALAAVPGMFWITAPIISTFIQWVFSSIIGWVARQAVMQAFFLDTAIRKASQAGDYQDAVNAADNLPTTATDKEYADAEQAEILAFRNFVLLTN